MQRSNIGIYIILAVIILCIRGQRLSKRQAIKWAELNKAEEGYLIGGNEDDSNWDWSNPCEGLNVSYPYCNLSLSFADRAADLVI